MPSVFGWVDFIEKDREKMIKVIRLFREQDTRDELGLGSVRDAFSNLLFPGTSTIQTRAKYMLLVPWLYRTLERQKTSSADIAKKARNAEIFLINSLMESGDTDGVIGKEARQSLQRLPSSVYWAGLGTWGIRQYKGSQNEYHRYLDYYYHYKKNLVVGDDKEPISGRVGENWDPDLPEPSGGFPQRVGFKLEHNEAEYLQERIINSCKDSLLAFLVQERMSAACDFIWSHPMLGAFPQKLALQVNHARNFSEVMHGAALLYNLMLAEKCDWEDGQELVDDYTEQFNEWKEKIGMRIGELKEWHDDMRKFWDIVQQWGDVTHRTKAFIETWINIVLEGDALNKLTGYDTAKKLIFEREVALKRGRARLADRRSLERWTGAAGTYQLRFRWTVVSNMLNDIVSGLENKKEGYDA
ncbi:MAG: DUF6361 family protein [Firmicutes bacterium]|nr:DUF6361 family protein [Bacillota bacterium]